MKVTLSKTDTVKKSLGFISQNCPVTRLDDLSIFLYIHYEFSMLDALQEGSSVKSQVLFSSC